MKKRYFSDLFWKVENSEFSFVVSKCISTVFILMTHQNKPFRDPAVKLLLIIENTVTSLKLKVLGDKGITSDI